MAGFFTICTISIFSVPLFSVCLILYCQLSVFKKYSLELCFVSLIQFCSCRNVVVYHQKMEFFFPFFCMLCAQQHAFGIDAHHLSRREIDDDDEGAFAAPKQTDVFTVLKRSFRMVIGKLRELLCFFFLEEYQHQNEGHSKCQAGRDAAVYQI